MGDVWSSLTTKWAVNYVDSEPRTAAIVGIGHHHTASPNLLVCLQQFMPGGRTVTPNYFITPEDIYGIVPENRRAYTSGDRTFDNGSITYEILNSTAGPFWRFDPRTLENVKKLDADIVRRYGVRIQHSFPGFWEHKNVYQWTGRGYATACAGPSFFINDIMAGTVYYVNNPTGGDEFDMASLEDLRSIVNAAVKGGTDYTQMVVTRERHKLFESTSGLYAAARQGNVIPLSQKSRQAAVDQAVAIATGLPLVIEPREAASFAGGSTPKFSPANFLSFIDYCLNGLPPEPAYGRFVKNTFELQGDPPTLMHRESLDGKVAQQVPYGSRQDVWTNNNPVEITYGGVIVQSFRQGGSAVLVDGTTVKLTEKEVDRANAQKSGGQAWL